MLDRTPSIIVTCTTRTRSLDQCTLAPVTTAQARACAAPPRRRGAPRVRSHCRFRKRSTEYISGSGMKRMSGSTKRQCDRALCAPRRGWCARRGRARRRRARRRRRSRRTSSRAAAPWGAGKYRTQIPKILRFYLLSGLPSLGVTIGYCPRRAPQVSHGERSLPLLGCAPPSARRRASLGSAAGRSASTARDCRPSALHYNRAIIYE